MRISAPGVARNSGICGLWRCYVGHCCASSVLRRLVSATAVCTMSSIAIAGMSTPMLWAASRSRVPTSDTLLPLKPTVPRMVASDLSSVRASRLASSNSSVSFSAASLDRM